MNMKKWIYRHYKWKKYEVCGLALHSETREKLVLYKCLYDTPELLEEFWEAPFFVRPFDMFNAKIEFEGSLVERFQYIGN